MLLKIAILPALILSVAFLNNVNAQAQQSQAIRPPSAQEQAEWQAQRQAKKEAQRQAYLRIQAQNQALREAWEALKVDDSGPMAIWRRNGYRPIHIPTFEELSGETQTPRDDGATGQSAQD